MLRPTRSLDRDAQALLRLNPWLSEFGRELAEITYARPRPLPETLRRARDAATARRLGAGLKAWNSWALAMLTIRDAASGPYEILWALCADADFSGHPAHGAPRDVCGYVFPGLFDARNCRIGEFRAMGAQFCGDALFEGTGFGGADFQGATVKGTLDLSSTTFAKRAELRNLRAEGRILLDGARFERDAWFAGTIFGGLLTASSAEFHSDAGFGGTWFAAGADFGQARFLDNAGFEQAVFDGAADFSDTRFAGNSWFRRTAFNGPVNFSRARFGGRSTFEGIMMPHCRSPAHDALASIERLLAQPASH